MPLLSDPVVLAASASIVSSGWMSGTIASMSQFTIPAIMNAGAPVDVLLKGWWSVFHNGKAIMPVVAMGTAVGYGVLSYHRQAQKREWRGFALGGVFTVAIVPFTLVFMASTNSLLTDATHGMSAMSAETAKTLLTKWKSLNMIRSLLPLIGSLVGLWNIVAC